MAECYEKCHECQRHKLISRVAHIILNFVFDFERILLCSLLDILICLVALNFDLD